MIITFDNWSVSADTNFLARQYDNLSQTVTLAGELPAGYTWQLLVKKGSNTNVISLSALESGDIGVVLTDDDLALNGYYELQIKGINGDTIRHTNKILPIYVDPSISGSAAWPTVPTEFSQAEARIIELNTHPPIPGDDGYWLTWNLTNDKYEESTLPLPDISVGPAGASAYEVAVDKGFTGTADEWLTSLIGPKGAQGPKGDKGYTGAQGIQGIQGLQGAQGEIGPQGIQGLKGDKGDTGLQGEAGAIGATGAAGYTPIRGTDYWTTADIATIQSYVDTKIGEVENGSY